ncbi:putative transcription factor WD40-like family [Medicago truncatula]|uniref:Putative transcription factor WD40-like family n=1 Tax=Medicago truncatula TaxID=3880 RepID=A0A396J4W8_MEDTR|nr:putative transcription factor WD40-like family [Medicago truncatula]
MLVMATLEFHRPHKNTSHLLNHLLCSQLSSLSGPSDRGITLNTLELMDHKMRRLQDPQSVEEAVKVAYTFTSQPAPWLFDELSTTIVCKLHQGSTVTNMEFHPSIHSIFAAGSENGKISIWEARLRERLISKPFTIWNISNCSVEFQVYIQLFNCIITYGSCISVQRILFKMILYVMVEFRVAFAKHLIHLYTYQVHNGLQEHLEIDAHDGDVNDLAFSFKKNQLCVVTCGDDKLIKVYSVLPHSKENIQVKLFSHHLFTLRIFFLIDLVVSTFIINFQFCDHYN